VTIDPLQPVNWVDSIDKVDVFWRWLSTQPVVAFDTETSGHNYFDPRFHIRLIQFGTETEAWVVDFNQWRGLIEDVFRRFNGIWVCHNGAFDISALRAEGVDLTWRNVHDTMIMMRLAEPTQLAGLKEAASRHVSAVADVGQRTLAEAFRRQKWGWDTVPMDFPPYAFYAALDTILTARLYHTDVARRGRESAVYDLEMATRAVCTTMEINGLHIDRPLCQLRSDELRGEAETLKDQILDRYGIAITSSQQLSHWFASQPEALEKMTKATTGGKLSVDKEVLAGLSHMDGHVGEVATAALTVRRNEKIAGTYLDNFMTLADGNDVVHSQIETLAARTGRMSIRGTPFQTLPKPSVDSTGRVVREAVIPHHHDESIVSCDFSQIELRLAAIISQDSGLIDAFREADCGDVDFFTALARGTYHDPDMKKSDRRRDRIKTFSYASLYGAGVSKMAWSAGIPVAEMREVRDSIAARYPGFFSVQLDALHQCKVNSGWVETLYGRKLQVDPNREYTAANVIIQGTAADLMKIAIVNMAQAGLEDMMLIPVHDEMVLSVPEDVIDEVRREVQLAMECRDHVVPLLAEPSPGCQNWAQAK